MTPSEAVEVLTAVAAYDRRTVGRADAEAWATALEGITVADALQAVHQHFRDSFDYLMPAHIRVTVRTIRAERVRAAGDISDRIPKAIEDTEDDAEHTRLTLAWLQEAKRRIGDGEDIDTVAPRPESPRPDLKSVDRIKEITEQIARDKNANDA